MVAVLWEGPDERSVPQPREMFEAARVKLNVVAFPKSTGLCENLSADQAVLFSFLVFFLVLLLLFNFFFSSKKFNPKVGGEKSKFFSLKFFHKRIRNDTELGLNNLNKKT